LINYEASRNAISCLLEFSGCTGLHHDLSIDVAYCYTVRHVLLFCVDVDDRDEITYRPSSSTVTSSPAMHISKFRGQQQFTNSKYCGRSIVISNLPSCHVHDPLPRFREWTPLWEEQAGGRLKWFCQLVLHLANATSHLGGAYKYHTDSCAYGAPVFLPTFAVLSPQSPSSTTNKVRDHPLSMFLPKTRPAAVSVVNSSSFNRGRVDEGAETETEKKGA